MGPVAPHQCPLDPKVCLYDTGSHFLRHCPEAQGPAPGFRLPSLSCQHSLTPGLWKPCLSPKSLCTCRPLDYYIHRQMGWPCPSGLTFSSCVPAIPGIHLPWAHDRVALSHPAFLVLASPPLSSYLQPVLQSPKALAATPCSMQALSSFYSPGPSPSWPATLPADDLTRYRLLLSSGSSGSWNRSGCCGWCK